MQPLEQRCTRNCYSEERTGVARSISNVRKLLGYFIAVEHNSRLTLNRWPRRSQNISPPDQDIHELVQPAKLAPARPDDPVRGNGAYEGATGGPRRSALGRSGSARRLSSREPSGTSAIALQRSCPPPPITVIWTRLFRISRIPRAASLRLLRAP